MARPGLTPALGRLLAERGGRLPAQVEEAAHDGRLGQALEAADATQRVRDREVGDAGQRSSPGVRRLVDQGEHDERDDGGVLDHHEGHLQPHRGPDAANGEPDEHAHDGGRDDPGDRLRERARRGDDEQQVDARQRDVAHVGERAGDGVEQPRPDTDGGRDRFADPHVRGAGVSAPAVQVGVAHRNEEHGDADHQHRERRGVSGEAQQNGEREGHAARGRYVGDRDDEIAPEADGVGLQAHFLVATSLRRHGVRSFSQALRHTETRMETGSESPPSLTKRVCQRFARFEPYRGRRHTICGMRAAHRAPRAASPAAVAEVRRAETRRSRRATAARPRSPRPKRIETVRLAGRNSGAAVYGVGRSTKRSFLHV